MRSAWLSPAVRVALWLCAPFLAAPLLAQIEAAEASAAVAVSAEPAPRVFYTQAGEFEIIVRDVTDAQPALVLGRSVWAALSGPLGLPTGGFSSPVSVRLVPESQWTEPAPFTVTVEPPGRVGVRVRWSDKADPVVVRRAFVQGLILRQAVAWHGVGPKLTVPLWLEQACTAWSMVRERPALQDAFQQEAAGITPPPLRALLLWNRGEVESRRWELASLWLFLQLQAEAGEASRWGGWLRGVVGGAAPWDTLPGAYRGLWNDAASLELWWQVAFHHQRTFRALPVMTAEASRGWMADRSRWLAGREGREVVLALEELEGLRKEAWVRAELMERGRQLQSTLGLIHPYYANSALSLGRVYDAAQKGKAEQFKTALADFERDAIDGRELEDAVNAMLDTAPRN